MGPPRSSPCRPDAQRTGDPGTRQELRGAPLRLVPPVGTDPQACAEEGAPRGDGECPIARPQPGPHADFSAFSSGRWRRAQGSGMCYTWERKTPRSCVVHRAGSGGWPRPYGHSHPLPTTPRAPSAPAVAVSQSQGSRVLQTWNFLEVGVQGGCQAGGDLRAYGSQKLEASVEPSDVAEGPGGCRLAHPRTCVSSRGSCLLRSEPWESQGNRETAGQAFHSHKGISRNRSFRNVGDWSSGASAGQQGGRSCSQGPNVPAPERPGVQPGADASGMGQERPTRLGWCPCRAPALATGRTLRRAPRLGAATSKPQGQENPTRGPPNLLGTQEAGAGVTAALLTDTLCTRVSQHTTHRGETRCSRSRR